MTQISLFLTLHTVDFSNLYSNYYQPTFFNSSQQATTTSALYENDTQPQYNNCYVLDDNADMQNGGGGGGRSSADYVVDHVDDYELGNGRKRTYSGGEDMYGAPKVMRQQAAATSVHDPQQQQQQQQVKQEKDQGYSKGKVQQSLLKGPPGKKIIKQEKDQFAKYEMSVPDIHVPAQTSPSSSTGSGKSFYSKDDLFTDEVPNELFGDDANTLLTNDDTPLLTSANIDLNAGLNFDPNTMTLIPGGGGKLETPSTSKDQQQLVPSDMQVTKFNGKSNATDINKLTSQ